ncbi:MAG: hypothetical protein K2N94_06695 [Lachnospiraceae bacterium]|nr:hypothetical protein [Lachnospiraceae bacterium]
MYEQWLEAEKKWIGEYCSRVKKRVIGRVVPAVLIIAALLFGILAAVEGEKPSEIAGQAAGGMILGAIVCAIYLMFLLPGLSPKRYAKKIAKTVGRLGINAGEMEQLGREFLEAEADASRTISFEMSGPKSKKTPARFVKSEHYAMLEGGYPYAIIVRLADVERIVSSQESKSATTRSGNVSTTYQFTLYTIGFYRRDREQRGLSEEDLPDEAMGFFDRGIRDRAMELLEK